MTLYSSQTLWNTILNYFTFLYGMFPCNLLQFTKKLFEDIKDESETKEDIENNNEKLNIYIYKNIPFYSLEKGEIEGFKIYKDVFTKVKFIPKNQTIINNMQYLKKSFNVIYYFFFFFFFFLFLNFIKINFKDI